jgi:hypothetical protein
VSGLSIEREIPTFHLRLSADLPKSGKLSEVPAYAVLLWSAQESFTGRLVFERDERVKHLYLKEGSLVGSRSNLVPEGIDMILKRGFLPAEEILSVQQFGLPKSREEDWDAGVVDRLRSENVMDSANLRVALSVQLRERVMSLVGWFDGRYAVQPGVSLPEKLPLPPPLPLSLFLQDLEGFLLSGKVPENSACPDFEFPLKATLRNTGGASVFVSLALRGASGKLLFERGQRRKLFEMERGIVLSAASSDPGETLGEILRRWQFLREDVIQRLESAARAGKEKFRDLLRREKLLSDKEISSAVMTLHAERILEAFSWRSGSYEFRGEFLDDAAQELKLFGASEIDATTSVREEEHTEKEIVVLPDGLRETADAISKLFAPSPNNALLVVEIPFQRSLESSLYAIASAWHAQEGTRTLLILVGEEERKEVNPVLWSAPGAYEEWVTTPEGSEGVEFLRLAREDQGWRNSDGIMAFRRFATYVSSKYDRVLWLVPPPSVGSPLLTSIPQIVFVVSKDRTEKTDLMELIRQSSQARSVGFAFRETDTTAHPPHPRS